MVPSSVFLTGGDPVWPSPVAPNAAKQIAVFVTWGKPTNRIAGRSPRHGVLSGARLHVSPKRPGGSLIF